MSEFNNLVSMLNDKNDIILSQQAKIDELEFKLSSTVNNFDNSCKTIAIHQKFLDDADVANKFLTDKIDELQARVVELTKTLSEVQMMSHKSISYEHDLFDKGWNQASKQVVINIHRLTGIGEGLLKWLLKLDKVLGIKMDTGILL